MPSGLDRFLEAPPAELIGDLKNIRQERAALSRREGVIVQLLQMILDAGGPRAEEVLRLAADEAVAIGDLRDQIRQVMTSKYESNEFFLVPLTVHQELMTRGNHTVTLDNVRTAMKRMADAGELLLPRRGQVLYVLPDAMNNPLALQALELIAEQQNVEKKKASPTGGRRRDGDQEQSEEVGDRPSTG
jgi:hypothetical protein